MTAVQIVNSRARSIFGGIAAAFLVMAGFFLLFFTATSRSSGIAAILGTGTANADAAPTCQYVADANGNVTCVPTTTGDSSYFSDFSAASGCSGCDSSGSGGSSQ